MNRREFLNKSLLVTGLAGSAGNLFAFSPLETGHSEVIVVGAGYAGLTAALQLKKAGKEVILLEARNRVGGRIWTQHNDDGTYFDLGGQWIGPGHENMYAYARNYKIKTFPTYTGGKTGLMIDNQLQLYKGIIPRLPLRTLLNLNHLIKKINRLAEHVNPEEPWNSPDAKYWDSISAWEWLNKATDNAKVKKVFKIAFESIFVSGLKNVSMLHVLFYTRSNKSFDFLMNTEKGAQQDRIDGGAQSIANSIAAELGEIVRYGHVVRSVIQDGDAVYVNGEGFNFRTKRAIVAVPPPVAAKFNYDNSVSKHRVELLEALHSPVVYKCYAVYERPFWRDKGLNGMFSSADLPVSLTFDGGTLHSNKGILVGFVTGQQAIRLNSLSANERQHEVLQSLKIYLGTEATRPIAYMDKSLSDDPFTQGCYAALFPVNTYTTYATGLATPTGRLHWAGTETSSRFYGYMEGAVLSGQRAAKEILQALG